MPRYRSGPDLPVMDPNVMHPPELASIQRIQQECLQAPSWRHWHGIPPTVFCDFDPLKTSINPSKKTQDPPSFLPRTGGSPGSPSIPPKRPWSQCHVVEAWDGRCMDLDLPLGLPGDSASWWRVFQWTPWTPLGLGPMGVDVVW